jgi:hypothetical protein
LFTSHSSCKTFGSCSTKSDIRKWNPFIQLHENSCSSGAYKCHSLLSATVGILCRGGQRHNVHVSFVFFDCVCCGVQQCYLQEAGHIKRSPKALSRLVRRTYSAATPPPQHDRWQLLDIKDFRWVAT